MKSIGERVKMIRKELGLNQTDFAKNINLSRSQISAIEKEERVLTERTLLDISREYGANKEFILTGEGEMFIDISDNKELLNFINGLCEGDQEKANLILNVYEMFNKLDDDEQKVISDLIETMIEKKHPTE